MPGTINFEKNTFQDNYLAIQDELHLLGVFKAAVENTESYLKESFEGFPEDFDPRVINFNAQVSNACFEELGDKLTYLTTYEKYYVGILEKSIDTVEWNTFISFEHWENLISELMEYVAYYQNKIEEQRKIDEETERIEAAIEEYEKRQSEDLFKDMEGLENTLQQLQKQVKNINKYFES